MKKKVKKVRPGPVKKARRSEQVSATLPPDVYDMLIEYMEARGLNNRSGTLAKLLKIALELYITS